MRYPNTVLYVNVKRRLSRRESQERTRARLIEAAETLFIRSGFEAASVEQIAQMAGYSRGAFYSNFSDKDELFFAVLDKHHHSTASAIDEIFRHQPEPAERLRSVRDWYRRQWQQKEWVTLRTELHLRALRDPALRARLSELGRQELETYSALVARYFLEAGTQPVEPPGAIALSLLAAAQGLGTLALADGGGRYTEKFVSAADLVFASLVRM